MPESVEISLDGLHPPIAPTPIEFHILTWGWVILGGVLLLTVLRMAWRRYRYWKKNEYRYMAIMMLKSIITDELSENNALERISGLLKSVALYAYSRDQVAGLYGRKWIEFLSTTCRKTDFLSEPGSLLSGSQYQKIRGKLPKDTWEKLIRLAEKWIGGHHV